MGVDVGAYKNWEKRKVEYKRPIMEKIFDLDSQNLFDSLKGVLPGIEYSYDKYILPFVGYYKNKNYNGTELNKYINNAKILAEYINSSNILDKSKYQDLINIISQGYALAYCYIDNKKNYFGFNKFEVYEKYLWEYDEYVEVQQFFSNEIIEAFIFIEDKLEIPMQKYLINTTDVEYIDDKEVNHNINEAISTAESILLMDNIKDIIIISGKYKNIYLKDILITCIEVWKQGAKIEISY